MSVNTTNLTDVFSIMLNNITIIISNLSTVAISSSSGAPSLSTVPAQSSNSALHRLSSTTTYSSSSDATPIMGSDATPIMGSDATQRSASDILQSHQAVTNAAMLPSTVFLVVVAVIGLLGNICVITVYSKRKRKNTTHLLILAMGVFDLLTVFVIPGVIYTWYHEYDFPSGHLCRAIRYLGALFSIPGALLLLTVTHVRYRMVCSPHRVPVSFHQVKVRGVLAAVFAAIVSLPFAIIFGLETVKKIEASISVDGYRCGIQDYYQKTVWPTVSYSIMTMAYLVCMVSLMVFNILIGRTAFKHRKIHGAMSVSSHGDIKDDGISIGTDEKNRIDDIDNSDVFSDDQTSEGADQINQPKSDQKHFKPKSPNTNTKHKPALYARQASASTTLSKGQKPTPNSKIHNLRNRVRSFSVWTVQSNGRSTRGIGRTTKMLFFISLIYILTYLPLLVLQCLKAFKPELFSDLNQIKMSFYYLLVNSPYLGCAANPLIYSICDPNFRSECRTQAVRVSRSIRRRR